MNEISSCGLLKEYFSHYTGMRKTSAVVTLRLSKNSSCDRKNYTVLSKTTLVVLTLERVYFRVMIARTMSVEGVCISEETKTPLVVTLESVKFRVVIARTMPIQGSMKVNIQAEEETATCCNVRMSEVSSCDCKNYVC